MCFKLSISCFSLTIQLIYQVLPFFKQTITILVNGKGFKFIARIRIKAPNMEEIFFALPQHEES